MVSHKINVFLYWLRIWVGLTKARFIMPQLASKIGSFRHDRYFKTWDFNALNFWGNVCLPVMHALVYATTYDTKQILSFVSVFQARRKLVAYELRSSHDAVNGFIFMNL